MASMTGKTHCVRLRREGLLIALLAWLLNGCGTGQVGTMDASPTSPFPLATTVPTATSPAVQSTETPLPTPAAELPTSLEEYLALAGLQAWEDPSGILPRDPIRDELFLNRELYAPFWEEFDNAFQPAQRVANLLISNGIPVLLEIRWNGVSSLRQTTEVEIFVRDALDPLSVLWTGDEGGLIRHDVADVDRLLELLPATPPVDWEAPTRFMYLDDPFDSYSEGMHIIDSAGEVIAFWDAEMEQPSVFRRGDHSRAELVNGFDIPFVGFDDGELLALWESISWIRVLDDGAEERFEAVDAIRRSELDRYQAGAARQADILLSSNSFVFFQDVYGANRLVDVIAVAGYLIHEVTHVNQDPVCTEDYAESLGMTLDAYALFLETGPGQAYASEGAFLQAVLDARDENGYFLEDAAVRDIITQMAAVRAQVVGRDRFPGGERVPTCADSITGSTP